MKYLKLFGEIILGLLTLALFGIIFELVWEFIVTVIIKILNI